MQNKRTDPPELAEEVIRTRAFQLYEQRGGQPGRELDDWFHAEAEILAHKPARADQSTEQANSAAA
jgi:hypothetical protein